MSAIFWPLSILDDLISSLETEQTYPVRQVYSQTEYLYGCKTPEEEAGYITGFCDAMEGK